MRIKASILIGRQRGQVVYLLAILGVSLFLTVPFVMAVGQVVYEKLTLQRAVDAAAVSAATWQARGLNVVADLNYALVAAGAGDVAKAIAGQIDMKLYNSLLEAQEVATKVFPGAAGWHYRQIFKANSSRGECLPLPTGLRDLHMFSLRLRRKHLNLLFIDLPLWMEMDTPMYWRPQQEHGPFIRLMAGRDRRPWLNTSWLFGKEIPAVSVVSQAAPLGGTMWDPRFASRLVPVSAEVPGAESVILH